MTRKQITILSVFWIIAVVLSCFAVYVTFFDRGYTEVVFLDVGQGDSCFIQTDKLSSVLIDGGDEGMGDRVLAPYLRSKSESRLDAVFLSHMHSDHINGVLELIDSDFEIKEIYVSAYAEDEPGYSRLKSRADKRNIPITVLSGGDVITLDNVTFKVIGKRQDYTDQNDMSMVLRFDCGENSILFTGDMTRIAEDDVLEYEDIDTDILKVAHHGSAGSSDIDFLNKVTAELFVISVGRNNRYNHPSGKAVDRLSKYQVPIARTDYDGTVSLVMTDNDIKSIEFSREREM